MTIIRLLAIVSLAMYSAGAAAQTLDQAFDAYERGNFSTALTAFQALADRGDAGAAFYLGRMYDTARGVDKDDAEAVHWYREAAGRGHRGAQFSLGLKYAAGQGVARDAAAAALWFETSSLAGYPSAQLNLGTLYAVGDGVDRDPLAAYAWWHIAAQNGNLMARENRDRLRPELSADDLRRAEELAAALTRKIAGESAQ